MKIELCDLCGKPIKPHEKITLGFGAIRHVTGAEQICTACAEAINKVDWNGVARNAINEARK